MAQELNRMEAALGRASGCLKEIAGPSRGTGWGAGGQSQMGENLDEHGGIFDSRQERQGPATLRTGGEVDGEDAFE